MLGLDWLYRRTGSTLYRTKLLETLAFTATQLWDLQYGVSVMMVTVVTPLVRGVRNEWASADRLRLGLNTPVATLLSCVCQELYWQVGPAGGAPLAFNAGEPYVAVAVAGTPLTTPSARKQATMHCHCHCSHFR